MSYSLKNTIVSQAEIDSLKDIILKRAQVRSQELANEVQNDLTTSFQNELMANARESFNISKNPFTIKEEKPLEEVAPLVDEVTVKETEIVKNQVSEIKTQISKKSTNINTDMTDLAIKSVMENARIDFSNRQSFIGALNFLNSQATISLIKSKGKDFNAIA